MHESKAETRIFIHETDIIEIEIHMYLKITGVPPIEYFSEEITKLAKGKEQSVAEIGGQGSQVWNVDHCELPEIGMPVKANTRWRIPISDPDETERA